MKASTTLQKMIDVVNHALRAGKRNTTPYRNFFAAEPGHADWDTLIVLENLGMVVREKSFGNGGFYFRVTGNGADLVGTSLPSYLAP